MATRIQLRRDTSSNWTANDPALAEGEIGFETNTNKFKIGNGSDLWSELEYFGGEVDLSGYLTISSASTLYATKVELENIDLSSASAAAVAAIVDSAPETLNTLNELAAALGDDANYASTVTTALGNKLDASSASTIYLTQSSASTTYLTDASASTTYVQKNQSIALNQEIDFTIIAENSGKMYIINPGEIGIGIFIPNDSYISIPIGASYDFFQKGTGTVDFILVDSMLTTLHSYSTTLRGQYSGATLVKVGADEWVLSGDLADP